MFVPCTSWVLFPLAHGGELSAFMIAGEEEDSYTRESANHTPTRCSQVNELQTLELQRKVECSRAFQRAWTVRGLWIPTGTAEAKANPGGAEEPRRGQRCLGKSGSCQRNGGNGEVPHLPWAVAVEWTL